MKLYNFIQQLFLFRRYTFLFLMGMCLFFSGVVFAQEEVQDQDSVEGDVETDAEREAREAAEEEAKEKAEAEEEERKKKEEQEDLEKDAEKLEEKLSEAEEEKEQKQAILNVQYSDLEKQRAALQQTQGEIAQKEAEIVDVDKHIATIEDRITLNRAALSVIMRQMYFERAQALEEKLFDAKEGDEFLLGSNQTTILRGRMVDTMADLDQQIQNAEDARASLEDAKDQREDLLVRQQEQESQLQKTAVATSLQVQEAQSTISEINGKLAGIQSKLSDLLGIGLSTDDIVEAAEFASDKTGVRKGFLLGMLIVETDLGRFTGGCDYKESRMNDARKEAFKRITKKLGYDRDEMKVSCPPKNYKGTGGAMGVAQFMSDTWEGYESVIAKRTGHNPPDPWNLVDGVMAMASKLKNDGATENGEDGEWRAAARYLGSCSGNTQFYCENVLYWADNYEKKL